MQLLEIIQKTRNNGYFQKPEEKLKNLRQAIKDLNQGLPLIGRIITRAKHYGGRIEKLEFRSSPYHYLEFIIIDCNRNGQSSKFAKTYRRKVSLRELEDIQI